MFLISLQTVPIILMGQKEELNVQAVHLPEMLNTFAKGKVNNRAPCQRKSGLKVWLESLACMAHNSHALCFAGNRSPVYFCWIRALGCPAWLTHPSYPVSSQACKNRHPCVHDASAFAFLLVHAIPAATCMMPEYRF